MKRVRVLVVLLVAVLASACARHDDLPVVKDLDLQRYSGRWHEVASIPAWFARDCATDTTAEYTPSSDGTVKVVNACRRADGEREAADGIARAAGAPGEGKLEVTFVTVLGQPIWLLAGDYWIVALDKDYRWSVVAHPSRDYGWILSRSPTLTAATLRDMRDWLAAVGYDTCRVVVTADPGRPRLCDV
ncbi:MAG: lipocalin family protein [Alphaproteobacteria bacterium]|nr:lipocalin family protein [Alphaproteobacteria bacterium]